MALIRFYSFSFLMFFIAFNFSACAPVGFQRVFWDITKCADPWHVEDASPEEYEENALEYLLNEGFDVQNPQLNANGENEDCEACICKTGERLQIDIAEEDFDALIAFGFTAE